MTFLLVSDSPVRSFSKDSVVSILTVSLVYPEVHQKKPQGNSMVTFHSVLVLFVNV